MTIALGDFEEEGNEGLDNHSEGLQIAVKAFKLFFDGMPIPAIARQLGISEELLLCYLPFRRGL